MADPSDAINVAVYEALIASAAVGQSIFHRVPNGAALPYIHIGDDEIEAEYDAGEFSSCLVTVNIFARSKPELSEIGSKVRIALDKQLTLAGFGCHEWQFLRTRSFTDPDGTTAHGVMQFEYLVQPLP